MQGRGREIVIEERMEVLIVVGRRIFVEKFYNLKHSRNVLSFIEWSNA